MLRDRIVCGCRDKRLQCKLLAEHRLTLEKAFSTAQSMELAEKGSKDMRQAENIHGIQESKRNQKQPGGAARETETLNRCGGKNHCHVDVEEEEEYELYYSFSNTSPITVTTMVNGAKLPMRK